MFKAKQSCIFMLFFSLLSFHSVNGQDISQVYAMGSSGQCNNGVLTAQNPTGYLDTPPSSLGTYRANCSWKFTIDTTNAYFKIKLTFEEFELGDGATLTLSTEAYGGNDNVTYSKVNGPPSTEMAGFGNLLDIVFRSGAEEPINNGKVRIFWTSALIEFETTPTPYQLPDNTVFRDVYPNSEGTLTSPNYPGDYPVNREVIWALTVAEGDRIQLSFNDFKLSFDDSLTIYNGLEIGDAYELSKYTGSTRETPKPAVSSRNAVVVVFKSSPFVAAKGFSITYRVYVPAAATTTDKSQREKTPLDATGRAIIIVISLLAVLALLIVAVYCFYFKPRQRARDQTLAAEFYDSDEKIDIEHIPRRPTTVSEAARLQAEVLMKEKPALQYGALPVSMRRQKSSVGLNSTAALVGSKAHERPTSSVPGAQTNDPVDGESEIVRETDRPTTAVPRPRTGGREKRVRIAATVTSTSSHVDPSAKPNSYLRKPLTSNVPRLAPIADQPELSEAGPITKERGKKKKRKDKTAEKAIEPHSPRKPGSSIRRAATTPNDLVGVGVDTEQLKLPGIVPDKEPLSTSQSSANLRPTSGRAGYVDAPVTEDGDEVSL